MTFRTLLDTYSMGLPGLIIFLVVSFLGVITKRASLVLIGAILSVPFVWGQSWFTLILTVPLTLLGASLAIRRKMTMLSWILFILSFSIVALTLVTGILKQ